MKQTLKDITLTNVKELYEIFKMLEFCRDIAYRVRLKAEESADSNKTDEQQKECFDDCKTNLKKLITAYTSLSEIINDFKIKNIEIKKETPEFDDQKKAVNNFYNIIKHEITLLKNQSNVLSNKKNVLQTFNSIVDFAGIENSPKLIIEYFDQILDKASTNSFLQGNIHYINDCEALEGFYKFNESYIPSMNRYFNNSNFFEKKTKKEYITKLINTAKYYYSNVLGNHPNRTDADLLKEIKTNNRDVNIQNLYENYEPFVQLLRLSAIGKFKNEAGKEKRIGMRTYKTMLSILDQTQYLHRLKHRQDEKTISDKLLNKTSEKEKE